LLLLRVQVPPSSHQLEASRDFDTGKAEISTRKQTLAVIPHDASNASHRPTTRIEKGKQWELVNTGFSDLVNTDSLLLLRVQIPPSSHQLEASKNLVTSKAEIPTQANPSCVREAKDSLIPIYMSLGVQVPFCSHQLKAYNSDTGKS
jgi:hypothetical protein